MLIPSYNLPVKGILLFPFILVRDKRDLVLLNHEKIHYEQAKEMLVIPFYVWYLLEYLFYRFKGFSNDKAYRSIRFEKEAYTYEKDLNYLKNRKRYNYFIPNR